MACTPFPSPKGEPRLQLVRTGLSSAAVSGLLTRSAQRAVRAGDGPSGAQARLPPGFFQPPIQRTPRPVLGSSNQSGPQGVALNVPADQQKGLIILDGKTLQPALIDISLAARPVLDTQPHRVLRRNPPQEVAHAFIFRGLQYKMPVVGHELLSQHPGGIPLPSLGEDLLEGIVVLRFVEHGRPGMASVPGVIHPTRFVCTFWSSQLGIFSELKSPEKSPDTFSSNPRPAEAPAQADVSRSTSCRSCLQP